MEYLLFMLVMAILVLVIFGSEILRTKKEERRFTESLYNNYFKLSEKE